MTSPAVTAIVPTYNRARLVTLAVESILRQTFRDFELIVIDDGSTDNTRQVLEPYASQLRYLHQPNGGKSSAVNRAVGEARGEWIAILDSDDEWFPTKLERQMEALRKFPTCGMCFTDLVTKGDPRIRGTAFERRNRTFTRPFEHLSNPVEYVLRPPHGIYIQTTLIRRQLLDEVGGFDVQLPVAEDTDMIFRLALHTGFACVNEPLVCMDRTPGREGLVQSYEKDRSLELRCKQRMYERWLLLDRLDSRSRSVITRRLSEVHNAWSDWHLHRKQSADALRSLELARQHGGTSKLWLKSVGIRVFPGITRQILDARTARRRQRLEAQAMGLATVGIAGPDRKT